MASEFLPWAALFSQMYGAYNQARISQIGYEMQADVARHNQYTSQVQAADARERGAESYSRFTREAGRFEGRQRATLGASGVRLDSGSPLAILSDTEELARLDAQIILDNAEREAAGYRQQALGYGMQGAAAGAGASATNPTLAAGQTLLTGAASRWDQLFGPSRSGRYGTRPGSQQSRMLAAQDAGLY